MTRLGEADLPHKAVYWAASGQSDRKGRPLVSSSPVEINCRWVTTRVRSGGSQSSSENVTVILESDTELARDSILWKGELVDLPTSPTTFYQIVTREITPCIKDRATSYEYGLQFYGNTLPTYAGT